MQQSIRNKDVSKNITDISNLRSNLQRRKFGRIYRSLSSTASLRYAARNPNKSLPAMLKRYSGTGFSAVENEGTRCVNFPGAPGSLLLSITVSSDAFAQQQRSGTPDEQKACSRDVQKHCRAVIDQGDFIDPRLPAAESSQDQRRLQSGAEKSRAISAFTSDFCREKHGGRPLEPARRHWRTCPDSIGFGGVFPYMGHAIPRMRCQYWRMHHARSNVASS